MRRKHKHFKQGLKEAAITDARILLQEAENIFDKDRELAKEHVKLARKICMKYKAKLPSVLKRKYCKHCHTYLKVSVNCRIRLNKGKVVYYCLDCKKFTRIAYK